MELTGDISSQTLLVFVILVLPGFISMRVYSLIRPGDQTTLKDSIFEALAYGVMNFGMMFWLFQFAVQSDEVIIQGIFVAISLVVAPILWPFLLDRALEFAARRGLLHYRYKTAWDDFFSRRNSCWLIVHLSDGRRVGGVFANKSYATLYPTPGHLFIEELWEIDQETGEFQGTSPISQGLILKPEDYRFVEIKAYI